MLFILEYLQVLQRYMVTNLTNPPVATNITHSFSNSLFLFLLKAIISLKKVFFCTPSFILGAPQHVLGLPRIILGTPQFILGTPQLILGLHRITLGTPPLTLGLHRITRGTPPLTLGTPQLILGTPRIIRGTPQLILGRTFSMVCKSISKFNNAVKDSLIIFFLVSFKNYNYGIFRIVKQW